MAQQTAEKSIKSIAYSLGERTIRVHSVADLVKEYSDQVPALQNLLPVARALDFYYIPRRYPNGLRDEDPSKAFSKEQAINAADRFFEIAQEVRTRRIGPSR